MSRTPAAPLDSAQDAPLPVIATPAVPVMTGTHFHVLDEKGRVIIPPELRAAVTEQFWMMLDENDNVGIYNFQTGIDIFEDCERTLAAYPGDEIVASAVERITGAAKLVTVENGWRVQIPDLLRYYAGLDKEVVTVGVLNHAAIWDRDKWQAEHEKRMQNVDVRRMQAEMLRKAASSVRNKAEAPASRQAEEFEEDDVAAVAGGMGGAGLGAGDGKRAASASTGHGRRSGRIHALSEIGR
jgi:MraZ protein